MRTHWTSYLRDANRQLGVVHFLRGRRYTMDLLMIARTALATSSHSLMACADCQSQWSHLYEEKYDASYIRRVFNKT